MMKARWLESACIVDDAGRIANLKSTLARGLPECTLLPAREGALAVTASGPSLVDCLDELRGWPGEIWAINGAYGFLLEHGITAHGFVGIDPLPGLAEYVQNAQSRTTFYIASTCDPSVFDVLDGHKVKVWHSKSEEEFPYPEGVKLIYGGTTAATRVPFLGMFQGWRRYKLFGVDSSYSETSPYCYRWGSYKEDINQPIIPVMINGEGPFYSEVGLLKQISQIYDTQREFRRRGISFEIHEAGLMGAYIRSPVLDDSMFEVEKNDAA